MAFENIIGHEEIKKILNKSFENTLHSYLFCGQEGIGKRLLAREFAKSILNLQINEIENCPDFLEIKPDGNTIKIEQIRYMNSKILEKPIKSSKKVYIINDSEKMTKEAQNSLLKTLEEPPKYAVIILICSQEGNLLTTIKSRCTRLNFKNLTNDELKKYFQKEQIEISNEVMKLSEGSITKALKILPKQDIYIKLEELLKQMNSINKLDVLKQEFIYEQKDDIQNFLEIMNSILFQIAKEKIEYLNCIEIIENTKSNLKSNGNFEMCIDNLLLGIWEEINEKHSRGKI